MLIRLEQDLSCSEIEVIVKYASMNKDVERIAALLKSVETRIKCDGDGKVRLVNASDIYYIESIDKMTFVYCERSVYRTELRLYQLMEELSSAGFVQINKACLLNINVLDFIKPLPSSRMEAVLTNGERLYVTRKYLGSIRRELQRGAQE